MPNYIKTLLKTKFGTFRLEVKPVMGLDMETRERKVISTNILVGGKNDCIQISVPLDKDVANLMWLGMSDGGCEINNKIISGNNTVHLVNLAFKIVKIYKHIKQVKLIDSSRIFCGSDTVYEKPIEIPLSRYYFLFHQETWYENKFGAKLNESEEVKKRYEEIKKNFTDPSKKTPYFDFNNEDLNKSLGELFANSNTWKDFLDALDKYPKENKCKIIYPWLEKAINEITQTDLHYIPSIIDLYNNPKLYDVEYVRIAPTKMDGGSKTRKLKHFSINPSLARVYKYKLSKYLNKCTTN